MNSQRGFIMADREQSTTRKSGMEEKPKREMGGTTTSGSRGEERQHGVKHQGSVGRDVPDQSKERNTEIAVEAGHKGQHHDSKR
jgi:hypothetical protein